MNHFRSTGIVRFLGKESVLLVMYLLITLLATLQQYALSDALPATGKVPFVKYNNYLIFKSSFFHLLSNQNLYVLHYTEHWDLFKYSPTFALFMGVFAYLPNWLGLFLWNLLNALVLFYGIRHLPRISATAKARIGWFCLLELLTAVGNAQSNPLIAGLFLWSFIYLERGKVPVATLLMLLSVFIKLFGVVGFVLFLLYPRKGLSIFYTSLWTGLLVVLPLVAVSYSQLVDQYQQWGILLQNDHSTSVGLSVMGWLETWFGFTPSKLAIVLVGAGGLLLPLLRIGQYSYFQYRLLIVASLLLWVVIFNHKAESPTFIIAVVGVGLWYFTQPATVINQVLVLLVFVFTILSPTDVFPAALRNTLVLPYVLKGVACVFVWVKLSVDLLTKDWQSSAPFATSVRSA